MSALERGYQSIADFHRACSDKIVATNVEKAAAFEHLQAATKREKEVVEWKKK